MHHPGRHDGEGGPLRLTVAGRTDRGVHAWGQVASYPHEAVDPQRLNALLPADVAVLASEPAGAASTPAATRSAARTAIGCSPGRTRSVFERGRACGGRAARPRRAARLRRGSARRHDFTAFTPTETEHVRFERDVLKAEWREHGDVLEFWIEADTFMRHMNRVLVGTMLEVASGQRRLEEFACLLEGRPRRPPGGRRRHTGSRSHRSPIGA